MDAEDSPWGDVPSGSTTSANVTKTSSGNDDALSSPKPNTPTTSSPKTVGGRGGRPGKKVVAQATRLEAVDGSGDPLGPLGESKTSSETEEPPAPPLKEQSLPVRNARLNHTRPVGQNIRGPSEGAGDDQSSISSRQRLQPSPLYGAGPNETPGKPGQPSVSIEQAARPTFAITVGDPHKVGDLTSSHIVYQVRTKTTSKAYKQAEFTVGRRYKDFLWLYNCLHNNNPGIVVPPPPEKQAVGRFDSNFVESRRAALERMLNKVAAHPVLHHDADLKIFLESDAFNVDVKQREHREFGLGESKGMLSSFGLGNATSGKFIEHDDWFHERKVYLDALENQLKALLKSMDSVVAQRKSLAEAAGELSTSLHGLAGVELSASLSTPLAGLSEVQFRLRELYDRQAQQDVLTLGITIDEYIRLIGSIKTASNQRQKSWHTLHNADGELQKRRATQDKVLRSGKTQQDRLNQLQADVSDGERRCHQARLLYEDMGRLMRSELDRFEKEKVEDFKSGVETFLEGAIEAQKELIEIWETFLMQLDADEEAAAADPTSQGQDSEAASAAGTGIEAAAPAPAPSSEAAEAQGVPASEPHAVGNDVAVHAGDALLGEANGET